MVFRRCLRLFTAVGLIWCARAVAQPSQLKVELHGDYLSVNAPQLHFLAGKAMQKLQNGSTLNCLMTLSVTPRHGVKPVFFVKERLIVSFDLWEETYSIIESRPGGRSASRLTPEMVEDWFLEKVKIPVRSIPDGEFFMIVFECRTEGNDAGEIGQDSSTTTLAALIDLFGRKKHEAPVRWEASAGPLRLDDLKK
jgi:hypothetical protein